MGHERYSAIAARLFPGAQLTAAASLAGGVSADVHRLDLTLADGNTTSVVLRAHGASHSGLTAELEFALLEALSAGRLPVPEPLCVDASGSVLTDPFVVMAFVEGTTEIPPGQEHRRIEAMAELLAGIHELHAEDLPALPARNDPLPEVFEYLPEGPEWEDARAHLRSLSETAYPGPARLLHGDFWPENLIWRDGAVAAILDWENAALGDPLSDVAVCRVELRYRFGRAGMQRFTEAYAEHREVDPYRLALWQVFVAAAAQRFMGQWGLAPAREAQMRREAMASLREACAVLMGRGTRPW